MTDVKATLTERGDRYGSFEGHAEISQALKHLIWGFVAKRGKQLKPDQAEALDMIAHKIARILNGDPNYIDNWVDIAGYSILVSDRLEENQQDNA